MLSVSNTDRPAFNTRSQTQQHLTPGTSTAQPSITPEVSPVLNPTPKSLTGDRLEALLQMQTPSANGPLNVYLMERHYNTK